MDISFVIRTILASDTCTGISIFCALQFKFHVHFSLAISIFFISYISLIEIIL